VRTIAGDTIAAVATAPGRGAIGVVRVSGPRAVDIARRIAGKVPSARTASLRALREAGGAVIDRGLVFYFPAPHSFTGEDVVELQAHGGPVVLDLLLQAACAAGARPARAGEFSERAFLNGRLDLAQAEAIADLIDAGSAAAARAAVRSLDGEFSRRATALIEALIALRADLEAALDFADESSASRSSAHKHRSCCRKPAVVAVCAKAWSSRSRAVPTSANRHC
jgi:tRNA modification GTPase